MSDKTWILPACIYGENCIGMKRADYDAIATENATLRARMEILRVALLREGIDKLERAQKLLIDVEAQHIAAMKEGTPK